MKKWKTVVLTVVLALALAVPAMAGGFSYGDECVDNSCNEYDYKDNSKTTIKDNNVAIGSSGMQGNKNHHNIVVGGDVNLGTNAGGKIVNKNKNTNTNTNRNVNTNTNRNVNTNTNTNLNSNMNMQSQGQHQGQAQGQQQKAVAAQGQAQSTDIKFEADKRELLGMTAAPTADAKVKNTKASKIRAKGDLLDRVKFLTMSMAKKASKNASDMDVEAAVLFENDFELDRIIVGEGAEFGGYIYVFADGPDCYLAAMDAEASEVAMKLGMTHIIRLGEVELTKVLDGSAWNIGVGGGASIMTSGEDIGIAPNGGLGYGKAKTSSEFRPDAVYEVSYSADLIREK
jgi:hypothetical protein